MNTSAEVSHDMLVQRGLTFLVYSDKFNWKYELCIGLAIFVTTIIVVWKWFHHHTDHREAHHAKKQLLKRHRVNPFLRQQSLEQTTCVSDKCDYVMVFPLRTDGGTPRALHYSGQRFMRLNWDDDIDGLEMANKVFECPHKPHLVPTNQLSKIFLKKMKVEEYHYAVCSLLMETLVG